ncbi:Uncharacterized protein APZ42_032369, partial [Daphnia magna]
FAIKPPKVDGWIGRRAQLRPDEGLLKTINATEESLTKAQLKIMEIAPPLIDLYSLLSSLPGSYAVKRSVQAPLQQWGRAFFHITRKRPSARKGGAFLPPSQDNTLAQAARVAAAASAAIATEAQNLRRFRFPPEQTVASFPQTPLFDGIQVGQGGRVGRGRRSGRSRSQRHNAWLQGGRRYVYLNPDPLASHKDDSKPRSKSVSKPASMFQSSLYGGSTAPMGVASRLKNFASHWTSVTDDVWVLKTVSEVFLHLPLSVSACLSCISNRLPFVFKFARIACATTREDALHNGGSAFWNSITMNDDVVTGGHKLVHSPVNKHTRPEITVTLPDKETVARSLNFDNLATETHLHQIHFRALRKLRSNAAYKAVAGLDTTSTRKTRASATSKVAPGQRSPSFYARFTERISPAKSPPKVATKTSSLASTVFGFFHTRNTPNGKSLEPQPEPPIQQSQEQSRQDIPDQCEQDSVPNTCDQEPERERSGFPVEQPEGSDPDSSADTRHLTDEAISRRPEPIDGVEGTNDPSEVLDVDPGGETQCTVKEDDSNGTTDVRADGDFHVIGETVLDLPTGTVSQHSQPHPIHTGAVITDSTGTTDARDQLTAEEVGQFPRGQQTKQRTARRGDQTNALPNQNPIETTAITGYHGTDITAIRVTTATTRVCALRLEALETDREKQEFIRSIDGSQETSNAELKEIKQMIIDQKEVVNKAYSNGRPPPTRFPNNSGNPQFSNAQNRPTNATPSFPRLTNDTNNSPTQPSIICNFCGHRGHIQSNCRSYQRQQLEQAQPPICYFAGTSAINLIIALSSEAPIGPTYQAPLKTSETRRKRLHMLGKVTLPVGYGESILQQEFIITRGISEDCILGWDAIQKQAFKLDGETKSIY